MFCYLFKLKDRTGLDLSSVQYDKCDVECEHYKDGKCSIAKTENVPMSNNKFGWMIEDHILFTTPRESNSKLTKYIAALSFIHPAESDLWIVFYHRFYKKDNEWCPAYKFVQNNETKDFDTLKALNSYLVKVGFVGRLLTEGDFLIYKG